ncbi:MAG: carboxylating nicotinate-nucleotide diphosphorylase [Bacteroidota bacterium]|jgi:nicotinate-nucleotide pyrophosphorylase (carboxylating)
MDFRSQEIKDLIRRCLEEDLGSGDVSSLSSIEPGTQGQSRLLLKEDGVVAGLQLAEIILKEIDPAIQWTSLAEDGKYYTSGTVLAEASGSVHALLAGERLLLNFMQRLSGIATQTYGVVKLISGTGAKVLDTRKTTPGLRLLEKWAVTMGGGQNHRIGLYDMVMLKDNHNDSAGGITAAVTRTQSYLKSRALSLDIEVETRTMDEVKEVLSLSGIRRIMLDNFSPEQCKEAVALIDGRLEIEASGGITPESILGYAQSGVNFISLGSLTHSVKSLDISFKTKVV